MGKMRIAVLGGDGYCGWATALYLSNQGHRSPLSTISPAGNGITNSASRRSRPSARCPSGCGSGRN